MRNVLDLEYHIVDKHENIFRWKEKNNWHSQDRLGLDLDTERKRKADGSIWQ